MAAMPWYETRVGAAVRSARCARRRRLKRTVTHARALRDRAGRGARAGARRAFASRTELPDVEETIARVKPSIVAVGTFERTRSPAFQFMGTGFVVGDGTLVVTNAHVLPATVDTDRRERLAILVPAREAPGADGTKVEVREARPVARDASHDLAVLKIEGAPLPALPIGDSTSVREGRSVYFTGFPIGSVLGAHAATHRAIVAAITPIAIPQRRATRARRRDGAAARSGDVPGVPARRDRVSGQQRQPGLRGGRDGDRRRQHGAGAGDEGIVAFATFGHRLRDPGRARARAARDELR